MKQNLNADNRGFSLVELIVTVLVSSLVVGMVVMFISSARQSYEIVNSEATLQTEAQVASTYIKELLLEADDCINGAASATIDMDSCKVLWIQAPDNSVDYATTTKYYYFVVLNETNHNLYFKKIKDDVTKDEATSQWVSASGDIKRLTGHTERTAFDYAAMLGGVTDSYALLAEHVENIQLKKDNSMMTLTMDLKFMDKDYTTSMNIVGRNMQ